MRLQGARGLKLRPTHVEQEVGGFDPSRFSLWRRDFSPTETGKIPNFSNRGFLPSEFKATWQRMYFAALGGERARRTAPSSARSTKKRHTSTCKVSSQQGGWYVWKPSSSSNFSIRALRAYSLVEVRQTILYRAIRADCISINSILPLLELP